MGHISFWFMLIMLILLGGNINFTEASVFASKEVGLEVNTENLGTGICSMYHSRLQDKIVI
jgi:hypothetical protein